MVHRLAAVVGTTMLLVVTASASPAGAHRWNGAFHPRAGSPGTIVTVWRAYKVDWNPDVDSLGSIYHPRLPTLVLVERSRPVRDLQFRIPDVPAGRYTVIAYDGSEGGSHYLWTNFRVTRPSLATTGIGLGWLTLSGLTLLALGLSLLIGARPRNPLIQHAPSRQAKSLLGGGSFP
jgi:hypothetical protein